MADEYNHDVTVVTMPTTPNPTITVEECFQELRAMFPDRWIQIEVSERLGARVFMIRVYGKPRQGVWLSSLAECMDRVRAWKQEQRG